MNAMGGRIFLEANGYGGVALRGGAAGRLGNRQPLTVRRCRRMDRQIAPAAEVDPLVGQPDRAVLDPRRVPSVAREVEDRLHRLPSERPEQPLAVGVLASTANELPPGTPARPPDGESTAGRPRRRRRSRLRPRPAAQWRRRRPATSPARAERPAVPLRSRSVARSSPSGLGAGPAPRVDSAADGRRTAAGSSRSSGPSLPSRPRTTASDVAAGNAVVSDMGAAVASTSTGRSGSCSTQVRSPSTAAIVDFTYADGTISSWSGAARARRSGGRPSCSR